MKAKTFENLIRKIIREEIDYALRREIKTLKEDLREDLKPTVIKKPVNKSITQNNLKEQIMGKKPSQKQNFVGNNTLNDLLNETAQGDTNLDRGASPVSIEGDFSTIGDIPTETAPKEIQEAITRDYSDLMKAIDKKKNHRP